jgi:hypothetical protein
MVRERATGPAVRLGPQRPDGGVVVLPQDGHLPAFAQPDEGRDETTVGAARGTSRSMPALQSGLVPAVPTVRVESVQTAYAALIVAGTARAPGGDRAPPLA